MPAPSVNVQYAQNVAIQENYSPIGAHVSTDDLSSVVTLTRPDGAARLIIQAEVANIAVTIDGSTPSATHGFKIYAGTSPEVIAADTIKLVQVSAGAKDQRQWVS
jgi:hypothetical protein